MENYSNKSVNRIFEFDFLRVLAVLAVIMIHVTTTIVIKNNYHSAQYMISNFFNAASRFAVPFFVMISGYFILDEKKEIPLSKFKSKIIKLIILWASWSCFYAFFFHDDFFKAFLFGHYHLWYMYLIIGLYLMAPVFRLFVKEQNIKYVYYCILLGIIFSILPNFINAFKFLPKYINAIKFAKLFQISFCGYIVYYFIGWALRFNENRIKRNVPVLLFLCFISLLTVVCCVQFIHSKHYCVWRLFYEELSLPVFIYSVSIFALLYNLLKKYPEKISPKFKSFISKCSSLTLGVYLVHASFLEIFEKIFNPTRNDDVIYIFWVFVLTTLSSFLITFLMSKIKYLKELVKF